MEAEATDLIAVRRRKLEELRGRGVHAYPNDFRPTHSARGVEVEFGSLLGEALATRGDDIQVAGRIVGLRNFGRAAFLHLQDRTGRVQVYVKRDGIGAEAFQTFHCAEVGDFLGVRGHPFRTKTGELTIEAQAVRVLAKAMRPLPEKWHGLTDTETRYRQRYLDLTVNPAVREVFLARARIIHGMRAFLLSREYLEVETPMMQRIAGGAAARPFVTRHHALGADLFLRIAPELYLKRLLVGGFERVFELNRVFRNEGVSTQHNPEFTMLEFYQAYATYRDFMELTEELFVALADEILGTRVLPYGEGTVDLTPPWRRISIPEYVAERTGVSRDAVFDLDLRTLTEAAARHDIRLTKDYEGHYGPGAAGYLLTDLFESLAEPELMQPTFVYQYPVAVSPLARRNADLPQFVDRFELFVGRRELANAFSELNDPDDQRRRFEEQLQARAAGDEEAHQMDEEFLRALEHGMPPAAGEGIGIDRVVMLLTNSPSIRDVILFPHLRPEAR